jgi:hypothetical protein
MTLSLAVKVLCTLPARLRAGNLCFHAAGPDAGGGLSIKGAGGPAFFAAMRSSMARSRSLASRVRSSSAVVAASASASSLSMARRFLDHSSSSESSSPSDETEGVPFLGVNARSYSIN